jgi:type II secretory pathway component GspD/PulD (secretin)
MRKKKYKIINLIISILLFINSFSYAEFKKKSNTEWETVFKELNIQPEADVIQKLVASNDTIENIQKQTGSRLTINNWINIFTKLGVQPKKDMQKKDWQEFLLKADIDFLGYTTASPSPEASPVSPNSSQPKQDIIILPETLLTQENLSSELNKQETYKSTFTITEINKETTSLPQDIKQNESVVEQLPLSYPQDVKKNESLASDLKNSKSAQKSYPKISLDLKAADIVAALKLISQKTNISLAISNNVKGNITIFLQDIDAFEAFKTIIDISDLAYMQEGNVYKIMPAQDYERIYGKKFFNNTTVDIIKLKYSKVNVIERAIAPLKSKVGQIISDVQTNSLIIIDTPENNKIIKDSIEKLDVKMETKIFKLNYSQAKDVYEKIKGTFTQGVNEIYMDERTNQIIVTDAQSHLEEITEFIASLDKRHQEVLIEAKIVQIILGDEFKMGVDWESVFHKVDGKIIEGNVTGNLNVLNPGSSGVRLSVGTLSMDNFTAMYDILQTVGKTDIISSPKIATIENKEAKILVGKKEAYVTTTVTTPSVGASSVAEAVSFIDVGIKLYVTPVIGDDGFITMKIRPEVSSVDRNLTTSQGNTIPIVRTSESETNIMIKDGVTVVIAGLMEERKEKQVSGVPLLCKIPVIGALFGKTTNATVKTELAVFLTPRIMTGDISNLSTADEKKFARK